MADLKLYQNYSRLFIYLSALSRELVTHRLLAKAVGNVSMEQAAQMDATAGTRSAAGFPSEFPFALGVGVLIRRPGSLQHKSVVVSSKAGASGLPLNFPSDFSNVI